MIIKRSMLSWDLSVGGSSTVPYNPNTLFWFLLPVYDNFTRRFETNYYLSLKMDDQVSWEAVGKVI